MKPPIFYRLLNALRAWCERDERLLVEHWKDAMQPEARTVVPFQTSQARPGSRRRMTA